MKIPNPIKNYREKKAEEKRRKEAERKKQQKRTLLICAGIFAALFVIIGIGALTEDDTPQLPEPSSQVETIVDESSVPEEVTPEVNPIQVGQNPVSRSNLQQRLKHPKAQLLPTILRAFQHIPAIRMWK